MSGITEAEMGEVSLPDVVILLSLCLVNFYVVLGFNRLKKQRNVSEVGFNLHFGH